ELEPTDTLRTIAGNMFRTGEEPENYDFSPASEETIRKLNTNYRSVYPLAKESPAIAVDFYGAAFFKHELLEDLLVIKTQIVSLNLDKMPVTDNDMKTIGQLTNLRKLNLSFSKVTGSGLADLDHLNHLIDFTLTNTVLNKEDLLKLASLKSIRHVYVWNCGISLADVDIIRKKYPTLDIETGMRTDTLFIKLNPPIVQNDNPVIEPPVHLKLKHYVPLTTIRYTLDGSEPDSLLSPVYNDQTFISKQGLMKAKAFKKGWHASDPVQFRFYTATYKPDTIILTKPADSSYKGKGGNTLKDLVKGNQDFGDGKWIAFRKNNLECTLVFFFPIEPQCITISSLVNTGALIFPPKDIRIMGGNDRAHLQLLYHNSPAMDTLMQSNYLIPYECKLKPASVRYIQVIVEPIGKLPKKFIPVPAVKDPKKPAPPKNDKGWFFIDEIFVN
ncbi:MAG TPA: FN3 associated domain-containing protein, partial [Puia sp.]